MKFLLYIQTMEMMVDIVMCKCKELYSPHHQIKSVKVLASHAVFATSADCRLV
jgi:hypothetical protein